MGKYKEKLIETEEQSGMVQCLEQRVDDLSREIGIMRDAFTAIGCMTKLILNAETCAVTQKKVSPPGSVL